MISGFRVCYTIMLGPKEAVTTNYIDPCITPPCFPGRGYSKGVQNRAGRNSMQMDKPPSAQIVLGRNPCALPDISIWRLAAQGFERRKENLLSIQDSVSPVPLRGHIQARLMVGSTFSLHCSSFWGLPYRILIIYLVEPKKGTTMQTTGIYSSATFMTQAPPSTPRSLPRVEHLQ